jgi:hypothetical protein
MLYFLNSITYKTFLRIINTLILTLVFGVLFLLINIVMYQLDLSVIIIIQIFSALLFALHLILDTHPLFKTDKFTNFLISVFASFLVYFGLYFLIVKFSF